MAVLRIQRLLPAQLVLHFAAMTTTTVASVEVWVIVVDLVGWSMLPLVQFPISIPLVAIVTVGAVSGCVFSHDPGACVELDLIQS